MKTHNAAPFDSAVCAVSSKCHRPNDDFDVVLVVVAEISNGFDGICGGHRAAIVWNSAFGTSAMADLTPLALALALACGVAVQQRGND